MRRHAMSDDPSVNTMLARPKQIRLLTRSLMHYRYLPTPIPVIVVLTPEWRLTHENALIWPPLKGLAVGEKVYPPVAFELEYLEGTDPSDPGHWVPVARLGIEYDHGPGGGMISNGMVINIPPRTLLFGGMSA